MLFNLVFSFLSISQNTTNITSVNDDILGDRGCGLGSEDIFFINSMEDINSIKECNTINGSLFINGDYNIDSLKELKNIEYITGYLVIYDSHMLKSLKGLENIKNIYSLNPYLLDYGVTIKYNNNNEDSNYGLCFADTINWSSLTSRDIIVSNNRDDCPNCHSECVGCFGPSRLLCQECVNLRSGIACVESCPSGTLLDNRTCVEFAPTQNIEINFNRLDSYEYGLNVSWDEPINPNGFILDYIILRNGVEIYRSYYDNDGYYSNDELTTQFTDNLSVLDRNYTYQIAYSNSEGSIVSDDQNYFMVNRIPFDITYFRLRGIRNTSVNLFWYYNDSSLVPTFEYNLNGGDYVEIPKNYSYTFDDNGFTRYLHLVNNLLPNTYYNINLRARYNNGNIGDITPKSFTTLVGNPPTPLTPFIKDNTLYWNETSNVNGDILFYIIWMNNTDIYNGSYLSEGVDLTTHVILDNSYDFMVTAYTAWNLYSNSERTGFFFFAPETTTATTTATTTVTTNPDNPPFIPTGDLQTWELALIITCIIIVTVISFTFLILGCHKLFMETQDEEYHNTRAIYNTRYENAARSNSISVRRNNIAVDEVAIGRTYNNPAYLEPKRPGAIKNTFYGELDSYLQENDEETFGFQDTDSVDYLCIVDQSPSTQPRRRSKTGTGPSIDKVLNIDKKDENIQNTAQRKMSLLDELKLKIPEMAPKNMMLD